MATESDTPEPDKKPPAKKSERIVVAQRIEEVYAILLDGAVLHDIVRYGDEKGWGVGERQIRKYLARARELLVQRQEKSRKQVLARHLAQRQALFARAVNAADLRTALAVIDSEAKLRGLFPEKNLSDAQKLIASLMARIAELERTNGDSARTTPKAAEEGDRTCRDVGSDGEASTPTGSDGSIPG